MGTGQLIAVGVTAFAGSGLGSIVTPWSQWVTEKRRDTRADRKARIMEWREGVAEMIEEDASRPWNVEPPETAGLAFSLLSRPWYLSLANELPAELRKSLEDHTTYKAYPVSVPGRAMELSSLIPEIDRIERKWKLI